MQSLHPVLATALKTTSRRLRLQHSVRLLFWTLAIGLLMTFLLILLGRLIPLAYPFTLLQIGLGFTVLGLLLTVGYSWLSFQSQLNVARFLDRHLKLDERLSTAVELSAGKQPYVPPAIIQAQQADTVRQLENFDAGRILPIRPPWLWITLNIILVTAISYIYMLPNPQIQVLRQQQQTEAVIAQQLSRFEEIEAELLADESLQETPQREVLEQTLEALIDTLQQDNLPLEEAMAAVSESEQQLATIEQRDSAAQNAMLNDLVQTFEQFDSTTKLAEALAQRDLTQAAEMLASAGSNQAGRPQVGQEMVDALRQAAQAAEEAGDTTLAESLQQAADALQQSLGQEGQAGDAQASQEALNQAAQALTATGQNLAGQEAIQQALSNIQQAREALAQSSPNILEQQPSGGLSQGTGQTGGAGRGEPGLGADGLFTIETSPGAMSTDNGPNQGRLEAYESLYAPTHLGGEGGPIVNPASQQVEGGIPLGTAPVDPNQAPDTSLVPYDQIYSQYVGAAGQALDEGYIPLGMKGYIRQYFGALEPGQE